MLLHCVMPCVCVTGMLCCVNEYRRAVCTHVVRNLFWGEQWLLPLYLRSLRPVGGSFIKSVDENCPYFHWAIYTYNKTSPVFHWAINVLNKEPEEDGGFSPKMGGPDLGIEATVGEV